MTIAAGFNCSDGVLVCADSELTLHTMKSEGHKLEAISRKSVKLVSAGAGSAHLMRFVWQECQRRITEGCSIDDAENICREVVEDVHHRHIIPVSSDPSQRPVVEMVFGLWSPSGRRLLASSGTAITREGDHVLLGAGYEFGHSVVDRYWLYQSQILTAAFVAILLLRDVKQYVQGCGGPNHILGINADGSFVGVYLDDHEVLEQFHNLDMYIREAMVAAARAESSDDLRDKLRTLTAVFERIHKSDCLRFIREQIIRNPAAPTD